jgi:micrococcal nuclease
VTADRGAVRTKRTAPLLAAIVACLLTLTGCLGLGLGLDGEAPPSTPNGGASQEATFVEVVDGDTIETSLGTVRLIGIDTPERGECGHDEASNALLAVVAPGDVLELELPAGQNDQDRHGRLIRYATTDAGVDLGLLQLEAGNAVARYDSLDGYPEHPREAAYHSAQVATLGADAAVVALGCAVADLPSMEGRWWEEYSSCGKLRLNDLGLPVGPFDRDDPAEAEQYDWFANRTGNAGDGDGDGLACE